MARLVLHIGTHKTGTTALQQACFANRHWLKTVGITYPDLGVGCWHHGLTEPWGFVMPAYRLEGGGLAAWKRLAADHANTPGTVLISSEEFSRGHPNNRINLTELRELAKAFDSVEVICSLRVQTDFLQSIYMEVATKRKVDPFDKFFRTGTANHFAAGLFLDYSALDDHLLTAFSPSEITYLDYAAARKVTGGTVGAVLSAIGCSALPEGFHLPTGTAANISLEPLHFFVAERISQPDVPDIGLLDFARRSMEAHFGEGRRTTLYTRKLHQLMIDAFEPMNAAFRERLAARSSAVPALDLRPVEPTTICREDLIAPFWMRIAQSLYAQIKA